VWCQRSHDLGADPGTDRSAFGQKQRRRSSVTPHVSRRSLLFLVRPVGRDCLGDQAVANRSTGGRALRPRLRSCTLPRPARPDGRHCDRHIRDGCTAKALVGRRLRRPRMPRFAVQTWALGLGYVAPSVHRTAPKCCLVRDVNALGGSSEPTQPPRRPTPFARLEALVVALLREQHASEPTNRAAELSHDINHKRPARLPNDRFGDHGGATRAIATATTRS
jgi:hypothetical protein